MKIKNTKKEYSNGEVTIVWQAHKCIHSEKCWRGLPDVFRYKQRPWVDPEGASTDEIKAQIDQCPSGALSYYMNADGPSEQEESKVTLVEVAEDGPLLIKGAFTLKKKDGTEVHDTQAALCRCGASSNKPFCDGSHRKIGFTG